METDTKRILLQVLETMREQQNTIHEIDRSQQTLIGQLNAHLPNFRSDFFSAESAAIVEEGDSADGLTDRIHRLSQQIRSQR